MYNGKIIFRADGSASIGMGHFTRTLALAEMLNQHFCCIFATRTPTEYQVAEIEKVCHNSIELPDDSTHYNVFLNHLEGNEIVVLDNYFFTSEYQLDIKVKGCKLVCIDDLHDKHYFADIIINHAEGIGNSVYSTENYTKLFLGSKYALVRKEFRETSKEKIEKENGCLVIMGGADPLNITSLLVKLLTRVKFFKYIAVVNGSFRSRQSLTAISDKFKVYQNLTALEIAGLMKASDFGILPASTLAIEACSVRLPFICGYFMDNQKEIYNGIKLNNLAICVENYNELTDEILFKAIKKMENLEQYKSIIKRQSEILDNRSDNRFLKIFKEL